MWPPTIPHRTTLKWTYPPMALSHNVLVFDNGFKLAFRDSPGAITDGERELMQRLGGRVDLGILAYQGFEPRP